MLIANTLSGQDGEIERRCKALKSNIVNNKIEWITQRDGAHQLDNQCNPNIAKRKLRYRFDSLGNLIQFVEFRSSGTRMVKYRRNVVGEYTAKEYFFHDKHGNLTEHDVWEIEFNKDGYIVKESLKRGQITLRTNWFGYDALGQRISQVTDSVAMWTMRYNTSGDLIEFKTWQKRNDEFVAIVVTEYQYDEGILIKQIDRSALDSIAFKEITYVLDSERRPIESLERRIFETALSDIVKQGSINEIRTSFNYSKGGILTDEKSCFNDLPKGCQCTFYEVEFRHQ